MVARARDGQVENRPVYGVIGVSLAGKRTSWPVGRQDWKMEAAVSWAGRLGDPP